jgi:hypothetical protein
MLNLNDFETAKSILKNARIKTSKIKDSKTRAYIKKTLDNAFFKLLFQKYNSRGRVKL